MEAQEREREDEVPETRQDNDEDRDVGVPDDAAKKKTEMHLGVQVTSKVVEAL